MTFRKRRSSNPASAGVPDLAINHPLSPGGITHVLLDANVLLPPRLSDIVFDLSLEGLFSARWSIDIENEFLRNWSKVAARVRNTESNLERAHAEWRLQCCRGSVHGHEVFGYEAPSVLARVPTAVHIGDRHVAAAALVLSDYALLDGTLGRVFLVSANLKHLAVVAMKRLGVTVIHPGKFIDKLTDADSVRVGLALEQSVSSLTLPSYTRARLLDVLLIHGANDTARHFAAIWGEVFPPRDKR